MELLAAIDLLNGLVGRPHGVSDESEIDQGRFVSVTFFNDCDARSGSCAFAVFVKPANVNTTAINICFDFMVWSLSLISSNSYTSFAGGYRNVVGTHVTSSHVTVRIEFPVFIAVTSVPLGGLGVLPFVLEAH